MNDQSYRPCVGIALFNKDGLVFVGERIDTPGAWQMPQGGIDAGETIEETAFRELLEEVGTDKAEILAIAPEKLRYDLPGNLLEADTERKVLWEGKFRGQEQTWVAMRFTGEDSDIDLARHTEPEFSSFRWVTPAQAVELAIPFKRETYRKAFEFFNF
ncbi:MAG: RNA pyrophosphohydrolase [Alphaproteobacteria bacterium]|nr:RNA pyrophosphohydrolase [Alphaproteobacteria bacterium]